MFIVKSLKSFPCTLKSFHQNLTSWAAEVCAQRGWATLPHCSCSSVFSRVRSPRLLCLRSNQVDRCLSAGSPKSLAERTAEQEEWRSSPSVSESRSGRDGRRLCSSSPDDARFLWLTLIYHIFNYRMKTHQSILYTGAVFNVRGMYIETHRNTSNPILPKQTSPPSVTLIRVYTAACKRQFTCSSVEYPFH